MSLLVTGLVVFFVLHFLPIFAPLRSHLAARLGERRYKGWFSILSGIGLVLIAVGFAQTSPERMVFSPWPRAVTAARDVVPIAFILLAASHMRGYIRAVLKHPMMIGVALWAVVHLLANGDLASTVLFGSFLAYAVIDIISATARHAYASFTPSVKYDAMAIVGGLVVAVVVMSLHRILFGVPVVSFSL